MSGFAVAPFAVDAAACEWQFICAASVLAQNLNCLVRRRLSIAVKFRQPLYACGHRQILFEINAPVPQSSAQGRKAEVMRPGVSILRRRHAMGPDIEFCIVLALVHPIVT